MQCSRLEIHLAGKGKSYGLYPVAAVSWDIFLRYGRDDPSKLVFIQQHEDSCLVVRDNSGLSSRLDRAIGTPLEVRQEKQCPIPVATGIFGDSY